MKARSIVIATAVLGCVLAAPAQAQIAARGQELDLPRLSPRASVTQRIGITDITIDYHRPMVRERKIWGGLEKLNGGNPFPWRAGANENTTMAFTHDVTVNGKPLPAGVYGFHIALGENDWTLIFSKNHTSWGSYFYNRAEDALRVTVTPESVEHHESLTYTFEDLTDDSATVYMRWEEMQAAFTVQVDVHAVVLASIRNELRSVPAFTWQGWYQAAKYCLDNEINYEEALGWINQSIGRQENEHNVGVKEELQKRLQE